MTAVGGARWHVEIALDVVEQPASPEYDERTATRFHIEIFSEEWGFLFCHGGRASWIRVTDVAFVHGRDEHHLIGVTPDLGEIGALIRALEARYAIAFQRPFALVRTSIADAEPAVRAWVASL